MLGYRSSPNFRNLWPCLFLWFSLVDYIDVCYVHSSYAVQNFVKADLSKLEPADLGRGYSRVA